MPDDFDTMQVSDNASQAQSGTVQNDFDRMKVSDDVVQHTMKRAMVKRLTVWAFALGVAACGSTSSSPQKAAGQRAADGRNAPVPTQAVGQERRDGPAFDKPLATRVVDIGPSLRQGDRAKLSRVPRGGGL